MTAGDAFLLLVTFALFVVLALAAVVWVMDRGRDHMPHDHDDRKDDDDG